MEKVFEETDRQSGRHRSYLSNRVDLDIAMESMKRDALRDNDDYQLITSADCQNSIGNTSSNNINGTNFNKQNLTVQRSNYVTFFII